MKLFGHQPPREPRKVSIEETILARVEEARTKINQSQPNWDPTLGSTVDKVVDVQIVNPATAPSTLVQIQDSLGNALLADPGNTGALTVSVVSIETEVQVGGQVSILDSNGHLLLGNGAGALTVDGHAVTQPVSAVSLPLPAGAAIEAGGHLASIDTKLTNPLPVSLSSNQPPASTQQLVDTEVSFNGTNVGGAAVQSPAGYRGVLIQVIFSAVTGASPTFQGILQFQDGNGTWRNLAQMSAAIATSATGFFTFTVYPTAIGTIPATSGGAVFNFPLPLNLRMAYTLAVAGTTGTFKTYFCWLP